MRINMLCLHYTRCGTLLHQAVVELPLATDGVDPDSKDKYGRTPLSWAVENWHEEVERLLINNGAIMPEDFYGLRALFLELQM
jgi:ankyrin repeat protein